MEKKEKEFKVVIEQKKKKTMKVKAFSQEEAIEKALKKDLLKDKKFDEEAKYSIEAF